MKCEFSLVARLCIHTGPTCFLILRLQAYCSLLCLPTIRRKALQNKKNLQEHTLFASRQNKMHRINVVVSSDQTLMSYPLNKIKSCAHITTVVPDSITLRVYITLVIKINNLPSIVSYIYFSLPLLFFFKFWLPKTS